MTWDVIIVGAGPAGLSAALILGRSRRRVLVLDTDRPRNYASRALHAFLTRDGVDPRELRRIGHEQLAPYDSVQVITAEATHARRHSTGFEIVVADGRTLHGRKLLIATGVIDDLPALDGLDALYGTSVFHCPYCDGWESRDQPIAVYSRSANGVALSVELRVWSRDIALCTDGVRLARTHAARLEHYGIRWFRQRIDRLEGRDGQLARIVFVDGQSVDRRVMFFSAGQRQASGIAAQLGCGFTRKGAVRTGQYEASEIPGVYVAGDASRLVQLAIVAAAEGAQAAFAINTDLIKEDTP